MCSAPFPFRSTGCTRQRFDQSVDRLHRSSSSMSSIACAISPMSPPASCCWRRVSKLPFSMRSIVRSGDRVCIKSDWIDSAEYCGNTSQTCCTISGVTVNTAPPPPFALSRWRTISNEKFGNGTQRDRNSAAEETITQKEIKIKSRKSETSHHTGTNTQNQTTHWRKRTNTHC